jgi:hypothetical protein
MLSACVSSEGESDSAVRGSAGNALNFNPLSALDDSRVEDERACGAGPYVVLYV